jgi:hypothetical protein
VRTEAVIGYHPGMKRKILIAGGLVAGIVIAGVAYIGPSNLVGMLRYDTRREGDYKVGDRAPDVALLSLDGAPVHLEARLGSRPTVLIFGSFT